MRVTTKYKCLVSLQASSVHSLAIAALAGRCQNALIGVLDHDRLQNAKLRADILFGDILQVQVGVEHQHLPGSVELPVNQPVLMKIVEVLQVFERNARFLIASSFLNPIVGDLRAGAQVDNQVALNLVLFVDELVPFLKNV